MNKLISNVRLNHALNKFSIDYDASDITNMGEKYFVFNNKHTMIYRIRIPPNYDVHLSGEAEIRTKRLLAITNDNIESGSFFCLNETMSVCVCVFFRNYGLLFTQCINQNAYFNFQSCNNNKNKK